MKRNRTTLDLAMADLTGQAKQVVVVAAEKRLTVSTVESCTGGLVAHLITEIPGASQVLDSGWVCYSNEAKVRALGVPEDLLMDHGAVSKEVAVALAEEGRSRSGVDCTVATTGIAGPTGATPGKPVGLMWYAVAGHKKTRAGKVLAQGLDRSGTKRAFAREALAALLKVLKKTK